MNCKVKKDIEFHQSSEEIATNKHAWLVTQIEIIELSILADDRTIFYLAGTSCQPFQSQHYIDMSDRRRSSNRSEGKLKPK